MNKKFLSLIISIGFLCSLASTRESGHQQQRCGVIGKPNHQSCGANRLSNGSFYGAIQLCLSLDVAPARHGSEPEFELLYNSANGNSWCGMGWDIDVGYIERESKYGVPVQWSGGKPVLAYDDTKGFLFSFKNKTSDLVNIGGSIWRAQVQSDFLQFNYYGSTSNTWVVIDKSGNQVTFSARGAAVE